MTDTPPMNGVAGRRVLVTGASSGLGRAMAAALAASGARVAAAARRLDALRALAAESPGVTPIAMDVADAASVTAGTEAAVAALGGLDALVANAGVAWGGPALEMPEAEMRRTLDVNVAGVFLTARAAAQRMTNGGSIVTIGSIQGAGTGRGVAVYAASKAAVAHLTHGLAVEWARHGVRVNALAPGYIPSAMTLETLQGPDREALLKRIPMRRFGRPEDLFGPLALLLSDASAWMTGAVIPVDGGHLVTPMT